jgi:peptide/nickel transport system permease protein
MGQVQLSEHFQAIVERYTKTFNLEGDLFTQYVSFLRELILHGNLGPSFLAFPTPAMDLILKRLPWTIGLLGLSALISWIIGLLLGALCSWKRARLVDRILTPIALCFSQVPSYIWAVTLLLTFVYMFKLLPAGGAYSPELEPSLSLDFVLSVIKHGILPAVSFSITSTFAWFLSTRYLVTSILAEDYLRFARAKGLSSSRIFKRYILRNILLPQVTGLGMSLGLILGGQIVIETIFFYPGIGYLFSSAIGALDYNVINGILIIIITVVLTINLIVDLISPILDPRVRYGG